MLLVIQIALGIVLAFVLLRFWRIALGLGVTVAALAGATVLVLAFWHEVRVVVAGLILVVILVILAMLAVRFTRDIVEWLLTAGFVRQIRYWRMSADERFEFYRQTLGYELSDDREHIEQRSSDESTEGR